jgi:predicted PurR-regulated permease PerM
MLTPFLAAAILAYALNPGRRLPRICTAAGPRKPVPRALAVVVVVVLFFAAIAALVLIVVPVLQKEIPMLQAQIPAFLAKTNDLLGPKLLDLGINVRLDSAGIKRWCRSRWPPAATRSGAPCSIPCAWAAPRCWAGSPRWC